MLIALTGTPGTGKTSVAKLLKNFNIIELNKLAKEKNFIIGKDKKRKCQIVHLKKLDNYIKKNYKNKNVFLVGHYSHLLSSDLIIVLRCHPKILEKRLKKKKYSKKKIKENLLAEILDLITIEALEKSKNIYEIDTTKKTINEVKKHIINILKGNTEFKIGKKFKMQKFCHLTNKETLVISYGFR